MGRSKPHRATGHPQNLHLPRYHEIQPNPTLYDDVIAEPFSDFPEDLAAREMSDERPRKRARTVSNHQGLQPEAFLPSTNITAAQSQLAVPSLNTGARKLLAQLGSLPSLPGVAKHFVKGISAVVKLHEQKAELESRVTDGADNSDALAAANKANEELSKANGQLRSEVRAVMEDSVATYIELSRYNLEYANNNIKLMADIDELTPELEELDDEVDALEEEVETLRTEEARLQGVIETLKTEKAALHHENLGLHQNIAQSQAPRKTRATDCQKLTADNQYLRARNEWQAVKIHELQQEVKSLNVKLAKGKKGATAEAVKSSTQKEDAAAITAKSFNQKEDTAARTVKHGVA